MYVLTCADGKWSLQELLHTRLPDPLEVWDLSQSQHDCDCNWDAHPEEVLEWPEFEVWAKDVIQRGTSVSLLTSSTGHVSQQRMDNLLMPAPSKSLAARRTCISAAMNLSARTQSIVAMQGWPMRRYPKVGERWSHHRE